MTGAPSDAPVEQLAELGVAVVAPPENQEGSGNGR
jgi:hypothetical protein